MVKRFAITEVMENNYLHYRIYDNLTCNIICCDKNKLNETLWYLLEAN